MQKSQPIRLQAVSAHKQQHPIGKIPEPLDHDKALEGYRQHSALDKTHHDSLIWR